jgi:hypothetical protein
MVDVARSGNFAEDSARERIWPGNYVKQLLTIDSRD